MTKHQSMKIGLVLMVFPFLLLASPYTTTQDENSHYIGEQQHGKVGKGFFQVGELLSPNGICALARGGQYLLYLVYCRAEEEPQCDCLTEENSQHRLLMPIKEFNEQFANKQESMQIRKNILSGKQVSEDDPLFLKGQSVIVNYNKQIVATEEKKLAEAERRKEQQKAASAAKEAQEEEEKRKKRIRYYCTGIGRHHSPGANNGIGRPLPATSWRVRVRCDGCHEGLVKDETKAVLEREGANHEQTLNCTAKDERYECRGNSINCTDETLFD